MEIKENSEPSNADKIRAAHNFAVRELLFHLDPCRSQRLCWEWKRYKNEKGYGVIIFDGYKFSVHRLSFEHFKGVIPKGFLVMHQCDNPPCWNPEHLFLGTHSENMQDMVRKGRHARQIVKPTEEPILMTDIRKESESTSWAWKNPA